MLSMLFCVAFRMYDVCSFSDRILHIFVALLFVSVPLALPYRPLLPTIFRVRTFSYPTHFPMISLYLHLGAFYVHPEAYKFTTHSPMQRTVIP